MSNKILKSYTIDISVPIKQALENIEELKTAMDGLPQKGLYSKALSSEIKSVQDSIKDLEEFVKKQNAEIQNSINSISPEKIGEKFDKSKKDIDKSITALKGHIESLAGAIKDIQSAISVDSGDKFNAFFVRIQKPFVDLRIALENVTEALLNFQQTGKRTEATEIINTKEVKNEVNQVDQLIKILNKLKRFASSRGVKIGELDSKNISFLEIEELERILNLTEQIKLTSKSIGEVEFLDILDKRLGISKDSLNEFVKAIKDARNAEYQLEHKEPNRPEEYKKKSEIQPLERAVTIRYVIDEENSQDVDEIVKQITEDIVPKINEKLANTAPIKVKISADQEKVYNNLKRIIDAAIKDINSSEDITKVEIHFGNQGLDQEIDQMVQKISNKLSEANITPNIGLSGNTSINDIETLAQEVTLQEILNVLSNGLKVVPSNGISTGFSSGLSSQDKKNDKELGFDDYTKGRRKGALQQDIKGIAQNTSSNLRMIEAFEAGEKDIAKLSSVLKNSNKTVEDVINVLKETEIYKRGVTVKDSEGKEQQYSAYKASYMKESGAIKLTDFQKDLENTVKDLKEKIEAERKNTFENFEAMRSGSGKNIIKLVKQYDTEEETQKALQEVLNNKKYEEIATTIEDGFKTQEAAEKRLQEVLNDKKYTAEEKKLIEAFNTYKVPIGELSEEQQETIKRYNELNNIIQELKEDKVEIENISNKIKDNERIVIDKKTKQAKTKSGVQLNDEESELIKRYNILNKTIQENSDKVIKQKDEYDQLSKTIKNYTNIEIDKNTKTATQKYESVMKAQKYTPYDPITKETLEDQYRIKIPVITPEWKDILKEYITKTQGTDYWFKKDKNFKENVIKKHPGKINEFQERATELITRDLKKYQLQQQQLDKENQQIYSAYEALSNERTELLNVIAEEHKKEIQKLDSDIKFLSDFSKSHAGVDTTTFEGKPINVRETLEKLNQNRDEILSAYLPTDFVDAYSVAKIKKEKASENAVKLQSDVKDLITKDFDFDNNNYLKAYEEARDAFALISQKRELLLEQLKTQNKKELEDIDNQLNALSQHGNRVFDYFGGEKISIKDVIEKLQAKRARLLEIPKDIEDQYIKAQKEFNIADQRKKYYSKEMQDSIYRVVEGDLNKSLETLNKTDAITPEYSEMLDNARKEVTEKLIKSIIKPITDYSDYFESGTKSIEKEYKAIDENTMGKTIEEVFRKKGSRITEISAEEIYKKYVRDTVGALAPDRLNSIVKDLLDKEFQQNGRSVNETGEKLVPDVTSINDTRQALSVLTDVLKVAYKEQYEGLEKDRESLERQKALALEIQEIRANGGEISTEQKAELSSYDFLVKDQEKLNELYKERDEIVERLSSATRNYDIVRQSKKDFKNEVIEDAKRGKKSTRLIKAREDLEDVQNELDNLNIKLSKLKRIDVDDFIDKSIPDLLNHIEQSFINIDEAQRKLTAKARGTVNDVFGAAIDRLTSKKSYQQTLDRYEEITGRISKLRSRAIDQNGKMNYDLLTGTESSEYRDLTKEADELKLAIDLHVQKQKELKDIVIQTREALAEEGKQFKVVGKLAGIYDYETLTLRSNLPSVKKASNEDISAINGLITNSKQDPVFQTLKSLTDLNQATQESWENVRNLKYLNTDEIKDLIFKGESDILKSVSEETLNNLKELFNQIDPINQQINASQQLKPEWEKARKEYFQLEEEFAKINNPFEVLKTAWGNRKKALILNRKKHNVFDRNPTAKTLLDETLKATGQQGLEGRKRLSVQEYQKVEEYLSQIVKDKLSQVVQAKFKMNKLSPSVSEDVLAQFNQIDKTINDSWHEIVDVKSKELKDEIVARAKEICTIRVKNKDKLAMKDSVIDALSENPFEELTTQELLEAQRGWNKIHAKLSKIDINSAVKSKEEFVQSTINETLVEYRAQLDALKDKIIAEQAKGTEADEGKIIHLRNQGTNIASSLNYLSNGEMISKDELELFNAFDIYEKRKAKAIEEINELSARYQELEKDIEDKIKKKYSWTKSGTRIYEEFKKARNEADEFRNKGDTTSPEALAAFKKEDDLGIRHEQEKKINDEIRQQAENILEENHRLVDQQNYLDKLYEQYRKYNDLAEQYDANSQERRKYNNLAQDLKSKEIIKTETEIRRINQILKNTFEDNIDPVLNEYMDVQRRLNRQKSKIDNVDLTASKDTKVRERWEKKLATDYEDRVALIEQDKLITEKNLALIQREISMREMGIRENKAVATATVKSGKAKQEETEVANKVADAEHDLLNKIRENIQKEWILKTDYRTPGQQASDEKHQEYLKQNAYKYAGLNDYEFRKLIQYNKFNKIANDPNKKATDKQLEVYHKLSEIVKEFKNVQFDKKGYASSKVTKEEFENSSGRYITNKYLSKLFGIEPDGLDEGALATEKTLRSILEVLSKSTGIRVGGQKDYDKDKDSDFMKVYKAVGKEIGVINKYGKIKGGQDRDLRNENRQKLYAELEKRDLVVKNDQGRYDLNEKGLAYLQSIAENTKRIDKNDWKEAKPLYEKIAEEIGVLEDGKVPKEKISSVVSTMQERGYVDVNGKLTETGKEAAKLSGKLKEAGNSAEEIPSDIEGLAQIISRNKKDIELISSGLSELKSMLSMIPPKDENQKNLINQLNDKIRAKEDLLNRKQQETAELEKQINLAKQTTYTKTEILQKLQNDLKEYNLDENQAGQIFKSGNFIMSGGRYNVTDEEYASLLSQAKVNLKKTNTITEEEVKVEEAEVNEEKEQLDVEKKTTHTKKEIYDLLTDKSGLALTKNQADTLFNEKSGEYTKTGNGYQITDEQYDEIKSRAEAFKTAELEKQKAKKDTQTVSQQSQESEKKEGEVAKQSADATIRSEKEKQSSYENTENKIQKIAFLINNLNRLKTSNFEEYTYADISQGISVHGKGILKTPVPDEGKFTQEYVDLAFKEVRAFAQGIKDATPNLIQEVAKLARIPEEQIRTILEINSPSEVMEKLGFWTGEGYAYGIVESTDDVKNKIREMLSSAKVTPEELKELVGWDRILTANDGKSKTLRSNSILNKGIQEFLADYDFKTIPEGIEPKTDSLKSGKALKIQYGELKKVLSELIRLQNEYKNVKDESEKNITKKQIQEQEEIAESLERELRAFNQIIPLEERDIKIKKARYIAGKEKISLRDAKAEADAKKLQEEIENKNIFLNEDSQDWQHVLSLLDKVENKLIDIDKIKRQVIYDKKTGNLSIGYQITDSRGTSLLIDQNGELLKQNDIVLDMSKNYKILDSALNKFYSSSKKMINGDTSRKNLNDFNRAYDALIASEKQITYWRERGIQPSDDQLKIEQKVLDVSQDIVDLAEKQENIVQDKERLKAQKEIEASLQREYDLAVKANNEKKKGGVILRGHYEQQSQLESKKSEQLIADYEKQYGGKAGLESVLSKQAERMKVLELSKEDEKIQSNIAVQRKIIKHSYDEEIKDLKLINQFKIQGFKDGFDYSEVINYYQARIALNKENLQYQLGEEKLNQKIINYIAEQQQRVVDLNNELDRTLAKEYAIAKAKEAQLTTQEKYAKNFDVDAATERQLRTAVSKYQDALTLQDKKTVAIWQSAVHDNYLDPNNINPNQTISKIDAIQLRLKRIEDERLAYAENYKRQLEDISKFYNGQNAQLERANQLASDLGLQIGKISDASVEHKGSYNLWSFQDEDYKYSVKEYFDDEGVLQREIAKTTELNTEYTRLKKTIQGLGGQLRRFSELGDYAPNMFGNMASQVERAQILLRELTDIHTQGKTSLSIDEINTKLKELESTFRLIKGKEGFTGLLAHFDNSELVGGAERFKELLSQLAVQYANGEIMSERWSKGNTELTYTVRTIDNQLQKYVLTLSAAGDATQRMVSESKYIGILGKTFNMFGRKFGELIRYTTASLSFWRVINMIKSGVNVVKELDTAMTEMRKVSNDTEVDLQKFAKASHQVAQEIGSTAAIIQNSAADWMRLGYNIEDAAELAKNTSILMNVSEFDSIDAATESMVAMVQAFKDANKDVGELSLDIIDKLNNIGNNFSISTSDLAKSLQRSSGALIAAGNDLDEAIALTTAANAIIQDPESTGSALKVVSMRLRGTSLKELEDAGEDTDGAIETVSKLEKKIKQLTAINGQLGISILDVNGNYKDTYEILQEIADIWEDIGEADKKDGQNRQAALLELMAGKVRSQTLASLLQNPDMLREVYEASKVSEGSAQRENEEYLASIEAHLQILQAKWQEFWNSAINRDQINWIIDRAGDLLDIAKKIGTLPSLGILIGAFSGIKHIASPNRNPLQTSGRNKKPFLIIAGRYNRFSWDTSLLIA